MARSAILAGGAAVAEARYLGEKRRESIERYDEK